MTKKHDVTESNAACGVKPTANFSLSQTQMAIIKKAVTEMKPGEKITVAKEYVIMCDAMDCPGGVEYMVCHDSGENWRVLYKEMHSVYGVPKEGNMGLGCRLYVLDCACSPEEVADIIEDDIKESEEVYPVEHELEENLKAEKQKARNKALAGISLEESRRLATSIINARKKLHQLRHDWDYFDPTHISRKEYQLELANQKIRRSAFHDAISKASCRNMIDEIEPLLGDNVDVVLLAKAIRLASQGHFDGMLTRAISALTGWSDEPIPSEDGEQQII